VRQKSIEENGQADIHHDAGDGDEHVFSWPSRVAQFGKRQPGQGI